MKDVAALPGDRNPRQMVDALREEAIKALLKGPDSGIEEKQEARYKEIA
jgi:hypothetical protein